jgi:plastocyanin
MKPYLLAGVIVLTITSGAWRLANTGRIEGTVHAAGAPAEGAVVLLTGGGVASQAPPNEPVIIDQIELRFVPQVVAVSPGTTVAFPNSDPILHNVFSPRGPGDGFDLGTYPPGETRSRRFTEPGVHVILCHVHPDMVAYVAVVNTPYHAIVGRDGGFAIDGVPPGRYVLDVWRSRRPSDQREVTVANGSTTRVQVQLSR